MGAIDLSFLRRSRGGALDVGLTAALDVGASKTVCLIGRRRPEAADEVDILGLGRQPSRLALTGAAGDFDDTIRAIGVAMDEAERCAGARLTGVVASYGGPGLKTRRVRAGARLRESVVDDRAAAHAFHLAMAQAHAPGRVTLHAAPRGYRLDGGPLLADPRGQTGKTLSAEVVVVSAPAAAVAALAEACAAARAPLRGLAAAPWAAAQACLTLEEIAQGAVVLDLGAASTGLCVVGADGPIWAESLPSGGAQATQALAGKLETSFGAAERAKLAFGGVGPEAPARETLEIPRIGADGRLEQAAVLRRALSGALAAHYDGLLALVDERLAQAGWPGGSGALPVALVGGCAPLPGLRELAGRALARPVRVGQVAGFDGPAPDAQAFAAVAGLLRLATEPDARLAAPGVAPRRARPAPAAGALAAEALAAAQRGWGWLRANF